MLAAVARWVHLTSSRTPSASATFLSVRTLAFERHDERLMEHRHASHEHDVGLRFDALERPDGEIPRGPSARLRLPDDLA
jgi:hypothetical protein